MKTTHGRTGKKQKQPKDGPRVTFCITEELQQKIDRLRRVEKRKVPQKFRTALNTLLDDWNAKNPQPNGKPLKITP